MTNQHNVICFHQHIHYLKLLFDTLYMPWAQLINMLTIYGSRHFSVYKMVVWSVRADMSFVDYNYTGLDNFL